MLNVAYRLLLQASPSREASVAKELGVADLMKLLEEERSLRKVRVSVSVRVRISRKRA